MAISGFRTRSIEEKLSTAIKEQSLSRSFDSLRSLRMTLCKIIYRNDRVV